MAAPASPTRRVIIDTDPGVDDALAILLAFGAENIAVEGLTIVCGNGADICALGANARLLARAAGFPDVPICLGDAPEEGAEAVQDIPVHVHGADGLGDMATKYGRSEADRSGFDARSAAQFLCDACDAAPGEITVVAIGQTPWRRCRPFSDPSRTLLGFLLGPLSNVAAALVARPDLPTLLQELEITRDHSRSPEITRDHTGSPADAAPGAARDGRRGAPRAPRKPGAHPRSPEIARDC